MREMGGQLEDCFIFYVADHISSQHGQGQNSGLEFTARKQTFECSILLFFNKYTVETKRIYKVIPIK
jgi:hypothetical protein